MLKAVWRGDDVHLREEAGGSGQMLKHNTQIRRIAHGVQYLYVKLEPEALDRGSQWRCQHFGFTPSMQKAGYFRPTFLFSGRGMLEK